MLGVGLGRSIVWKHPPWATFALALANVLTFLILMDKGPEEALADRFGFLPAEREPLTFFTHTFVQADIGQLIGNLLLLLWAGVAVEFTVGSWFCVVIFLVGTLLGLGWFWLCAPAATMPLIGASGGVAGLTGCCLALFRRGQGERQTPSPVALAKPMAVVLLAAWGLHELFQFGITRGGYCVGLGDLGSLLAGVMLGLLVKRRRDRADGDHRNGGGRLEQRQRLYQAGMKHLKAKEIEQAYDCFERLLEQNPEDVEVLLQLYKVARFDPQSPGYRSVAERLLRTPPDVRLSVGNLHEVYADWKRFGLEVLPADLAVSLAKRFCAADQVDAAEAIAQDLLRGGCDEEQTAELLFALASQAARGGHFGKQQLYLNLMLERFPHQEATRSARQLLGG